MHQRQASNLVTYHFDSFPDRLVHAAFTRKGGISKGEFGSLNVGMTGGDDQANVTANLKRIAQNFGTTISSLRWTKQVHGSDVVIVKSTDADGLCQQAADGMVTADSNVALLMRFADCVPIVVYDPIQHTLGLAHAGWRGTVSKVARAVVETMHDVFESLPQDMIAGIGPSISVDHYEVGSGVIEAARAAFGEPIEEAIISRNGGKHYFDLWIANRIVLQEAGVRQIEIAEICTATRTDEFYSHRAESGKTGRFAVAAMLK